MIGHDVPIKIAVALPTYNRPEGLRRALVSLRKQSRLPDAVLIVNDAGRAVEIDESERTVLNPTVVAHEVNRGNAAARNTAIGLLKAFDLVAFLDDDDEFDASFIESACACFSANADMMFGWPGHRIWIDLAEGPQLVATDAWAGPTRGVGKLAWLRERRTGASGLVFRPSVMDHVGQFDDRLRAAVDTDWLVRAGEQRSALLQNCWLDVHRESVHAGVSSSFEKRYHAYNIMLEKHSDILAADRELNAQVHGRTGRLALAAGKVADARRLLWKSLRLDPRMVSFVSLSLCSVPGAPRIYKAAVRAWSNRK